ncbi:hypothetical protein [Scatolibacter rhodanostii]|uniref:hypothetical protein n=1 Tax=Scatolibacter rhodanostii TaxID=2014781 RepID=UPI000C07F458|nr:hypothetical protein [Scatolibacter rhodanostii]
MKRYIDAELPKQAEVLADEVVRLKSLLLGMKAKYELVNKAFTQYLCDTTVVPDVDGKENLLRINSLYQRYIKQAQEEQHG